MTTEERIPSTIQATIHQDAINRVSEFFNATTRDILRELPAERPPLGGHAGGGDDRGHDHHGVRRRDGYREPGLHPGLRTDRVGGSSPP